MGAEDCATTTAVPGVVHGDVFIFRTVQALLGSGGGWPARLHLKHKADQFAQAIVHLMFRTLEANRLLERRRIGHQAETTPSPAFPAPTSAFFNVSLGPGQGALCEFPSAVPVFDSHLGLVFSD